ELGDGNRLDGTQQAPVGLVQRDAASRLRVEDALEAAGRDDVVGLRGERVEEGDERLAVDLRVEHDATDVALLEPAGQVVESAQADRHVRPGEPEGAAPDLEGERSIALDLTAEDPV